MELNGRPFEFLFFFFLGGGGGRGGGGGWVLKNFEKRFQDLKARAEKSCSVL